MYKISPGASFADSVGRIMFNPYLLPQPCPPNLLVREDGWIVNEDTDEQIVRWWITVVNDGGNEADISPVYLQNISSFEQYRFDVVQDCKFIVEEATPNFNAICEAGFVCAKRNDMYLFFKATGEGSFYTDISNAPPPEEVEPHFDIGNDYVMYEKAIMACNGAKSAINQAFDKAFMKSLPQPPKRVGVPLHVVINDRTYYYQSVSIKSRFEWSKVAWPEDEAMNISL